MQSLTVAVLLLAVVSVLAGSEPEEQCCVLAVNGESGSDEKLCYEANELSVGNQPEPDACQGGTFTCFIDPCQFATCDQCGDAVCVQNNCEPCGYDFYLQHDERGNMEVNCSQQA